MNTEIKPKTFEQCCDEVLKPLGWDSMHHFLSRRSHSREGELSVIKIQKQAAQLWREEGIKEAVKLARPRKTCDDCDCDHSEFLCGGYVKYTEQEIIEKLKV